MRKLKIASLVVASAALTACAQPPANHLIGSAPRTISLTEGDPAGVLIVGKPRERRNVHVLVLHSYDPDTNLLVSPQKGGKSFKLNGGGRAVSIVDEIDDVQYLLQKLPADRYYLTEVYWGPSGRTMLSNGSIAIDVKPGKVTYVGNLDFDLPIFIFGDVDITTIETKSDVAIGLLKQYPNITSDLQTLSLNTFKLDCPLEDGIEACYAP